jgi:hypothetical protein
MEPRRFRLNRPTLGVHSDGEKRCCVTVPAGEIVEAEAQDILENKRTVEVRWAQRIVTMFAEDLLARGIPVDAATLNRDDRDTNLPLRTAD